jgi:hypothetical protein
MPPASPDDVLTNAMQFDLSILPGRVTCAIISVQRLTSAPGIDDWLARDVTFHRNMTLTRGEEIPYTQSLRDARVTETSGGKGGAPKGLSPPAPLGQ